MRWLLIAPVVVALCACDESTTEVEEPEPEDRVCPDPGPEKAPDLVAILDSLAFRAETNVVGGTPPKIRITVTMTNTSDSEIETEWGGCDIWIRAYCSPRRLNLAWDQYAWADGGCGVSAPWNIVLAPGESEVLQSLEVWVSSVLGDSLLPGEYSFGSILTYGLIGESPGVVPQRLFEMPAGSAEIQ